MKKKIAYAVFTLTNSGLDYIVKGNFGADQDKAKQWAENHVSDLVDVAHITAHEGDKGLKFPNGLFVKLIEY